MNFDQASLIRKELKRFWKAYKAIQKETGERNESNDDNFSWQYYFGGEGVADYVGFPEVTNWQLIDYLLGRQNPNTREEDEINFSIILNYKK